jgi:uncharacterized integral membrane protein
MNLDMGAIIAIMIALVTSSIVMMYSIAENMQLRKEIRRLQVALRTERLKK